MPRALVALAWLLHKPVITAPIVGATKLEHLDDALGSLEVKLSSEEIAALEEPYAPHAVAGFASRNCSRNKHLSGRGEEALSPRRGSGRRKPAVPLLSASESCSNT